MAARKWGRYGVSPEEWDASIAALIDLGRWSEAVLSMTKATEEARTGARFEQLLRLFGQVSVDVLDDSAIRLHLRLLGNVQPGERVEEQARLYMSVGESRPFLSAYLGWALIHREADCEGLVWVTQSLANESALTDFELLLAWRARGRAQRRLGHAGWRETFETAVKLGSGRAQGITLMEFGTSLVFAADHAAAMEVFGQARLAFRGDELEAWALGSEGIAHLHCCNLNEAEACFREMFQLGGRFRSRALSGQGSVLRTRGEWARASWHYAQAEVLAELSGDQDDLRQTRRGLGHTQRLAGQALRALETLAQAALSVEADRVSGNSWVNVDRAAAHVSLPRLDRDRIEDLLSRTGPLSAEDSDRAVIVRSELARRLGQTASACALLTGLDERLLWVREESMAFPELFALLPGDRRPELLPRSERMQVEVRAAGYPEVRINHRLLRLPAQALMVLIGLLEGQGTADSETLAAVVSDGKPRDKRQARQRASKAVSALRNALAWEDSVLVHGGHYELDPEVDWIYDIAEMRRRGVPVHSFLRGIQDFPWVMEREQELLQADSTPLSAQGALS